MNSNLWFCLQCGSLGCGRAQFGGTGGKGHALQHYAETGHCVNVKLGTITAEGSAGKTALFPLKQLVFRD